MKKFTSTEITEQLAPLDGWRFEDGFIVKNFVFDDFQEAFAFMTRVAFIQESLNHHTDWSGVYNKVTLRIRTHDADGITAKDIELAKIVNRKSSQS